MKINKNKFEQLLNQEQTGQHAEQQAGGYPLTDLDSTGLVAQLAALPAEFDVRELLTMTDPDQDENDWHDRMFLVARLALLAPAADSVPQPQHVAGDWQVGWSDDGYTYVLGDLTITGNFFSDGRLLVLGNLTVEGIWHDDYGITIVAGNLTAGRSLYTDGVLSVGGRLQAPYVYLDFNQGATVALGGCRTRLLLESDHGGSWLAGGTEQVDYWNLDELHFEHQPDEYTHLPAPDHLTELFQPGFIAPFAARYAAHLADEDEEPWVLSDLMQAAIPGFKPGNDTILQPTPGWPDSQPLTPR